MGGRRVNAQKDKGLYDAVYIRIVTARRQLEKEVTGVAGTDLSVNTSKMTGSDIESMTLKAVEAISTDAAVNYIHAHPLATMKEFSQELVGMPLRLSGSTARAYRLASNKLWYARKKANVPSPIQKVGGRK